MSCGEGRRFSLGVVQAGSYSFDSTPSLGTSIWHRYGPKKQQNKQKNPHQTVATPKQTQVQKEDWSLRDWWTTRSSSTKGLFWHSSFALWLMRLFQKLWKIITESDFWSPHIFFQIEKNNVNKASRLIWQKKIKMASSPIFGVFFFFFFFWSFKATLTAHGGSQVLLSFKSRVTLTT